MLQYFGERFERKDCKRTCDNCKHAAQCERRDMTSLARGAMRIVRAKKITLAMLVDAVKGSSVQARRCCCYFIRGTLPNDCNCAGTWWGAAVVPASVVVAVHTRHATWFLCARMHALSLWRLLLCSPLAVVVAVGDRDGAGRGWADGA